mgnify:CR=1 FL=1
MKESDMKKWRITFESGWLGCDPDQVVVKVIEAKDFEEAYRLAKWEDWNPDAYANIIGIVPED